MTYAPHPHFEWRREANMKKFTPACIRQKNNATMLSRSNFLTRIAAAHGILATGSLWADNKIVSAQSQPLHHDLK